MPRLSTNFQAVLRAYTESPRINAVSIGAEALFLRLVCLSDGAGRYYGDPFDVCARACTARMKNGLTPDDVGGYLDELEGADLITKYEFAGQPYLHVNRYHDAGNRAKEEFPPPPGVPEPVPPATGDDDPPAGDKKPPAKKKRGKKRAKKPATGDSRARNTNTNTNNNTSTNTNSAGAGARPEEGDRGETVDNSTPAKVGQDRAKEAHDLARHLAFTHLVPLGVPLDAVPELLEHLEGPRWAGGHTFQDCEEAARTLALRTRGVPNPGEEILQAIRQESASQGGLAVATPPETALASPTLDASGERGSTVGSDAEASTAAPVEPDRDAQKAKHHMQYARDLETQAHSIRQSRPEEAEALEQTAKQHRAAAKRLGA